MITASSLVLALAAVAATAQPLAEPVMDATSWAFMLTAWVCVGGLLTWCFWRVLGGGPKT